MDPDNVTEDPTAIEAGVGVNETLVDGRVNVVNVVETLVLVDVSVHTLAVVVAVVTDVEVTVELVVVRNVDVPVVVVVVVGDDELVA